MGLLSKLKYLTLGGPERSRLLTKIADVEYNRKWYEIQSSYLQNAIIKSHMNYPKKLKYLTFCDPERSMPLTEILDAEYLANGERY